MFDGNKRKRRFYFAPDKNRVVFFKFCAYFYYALNFEYFPILENAFSKEVLLKIGNIVSTLFLKEGKALQRLEFAKLMLSKGEPLEKIKVYTGLSMEALKKLKSAEQKNGRQRALNSARK